jgi:hypothetical protein
VEALHPGAVFVERERTGRRGPLVYALVAWKPEAEAGRVELAAVAVHGPRAWDLDLTAPAADFGRARSLLEQELAALAQPPEPPAGEPTLTARGRAVRLPAEGLADLIWDFEVLLASCSLETTAGGATAAGAFDLALRYARPRDLGLHLRGAPARILEAHVYGDSARNEGWPLQRVRDASGEVGLAKCDGGATLALLCRPELRPHAPAAVTRSCRPPGP